AAAARADESRIAPAAHAAAVRTGRHAERLRTSHRSVGRTAQVLAGAGQARIAPLAAAAAVGADRHARAVGTELVGAGRDLVASAGVVGAVVEALERSALEIEVEARGAPEV